MTGIVARIRRHLADPDSQHRQIAVGFLWVGMFVFVGKLAGAAKEMTIAWRYGVSATVDAYVFIFNLVNWPVSIWFSILTVVLVPLVARLRSDNPQELPRFRAELLGLTLLLGLGLGLLAWWGLPVLLRAGWLGLSGSALQQGLAMASGMALLLPLGAAISLWSVWLLAAGRHRNTLFEAIPAFTLLLALLLPPGWLPEPLLWGTVAGFALHAAALATPLRTAGELPAPRLAQRSPAWRAFWGGMGVMSVGQALMSITNLVDQFFAVGLGDGALATLSYANRLLALILGLLATAISRATLPVFSTATQNIVKTKALALHWAWLIFVFANLISIIFYFASSWIIELLFQRGSFVSQDSARVAEVFRYALFQIPFYAFALTLVSWVASRKKYGVLLFSGLIGLMIKIVSMPILVDLMSLNGLILSSAFVYLANSLFFFLILKNESK